MVSTYREMKPFVCLAVPLVTLNDTSTDHYTRHENYLQSRWLTDITDVPSELTLPDYGYQLLWYYTRAFLPSIFSQLEISYLIYGWIF